MNSFLSFLQHAILRLFGNSFILTELVTVISKILNMKNDQVNWQTKTQKISKQKNNIINQHNRITI